MDCMEYTEEDGSSTTAIEDDSTSVFKQHLTLETYLKIVNILILQSPEFSSKFDYSDTEKEELNKFFEKHKRNFYINKNTNMPKFILKVVDEQLETFDDGVVRFRFCKYDRKNKTCSYKDLVPLEKVKEILQDLHNINIVKDTCHPNSSALTKLFNEKYYFRGISKVVTTFLQECDSCRTTNTLKQTSLPPPIPIRSFYPHQRLQFDLIILATKRKPYFKNNNWKFRNILTVKCTFSKFVWLFPIGKKEAINVFTPLKFLFERDGFPEIFQSDNGKEFVATLITNFLNTYKVKIKHGKPYHPQSQGQVENANKTVKRHLNLLLANVDKAVAGRIWPLLLPGIASIMNNTWNSTIDDIPFRLYHNREPADMKHHVIPDDLSFTSSGEQVEGVLSESDDSDEDQDDSDKEEGEITDHYEVGQKEIYQSCSSASLSSLLLREGQTKLDEGQETSVFSEEKEFDKLKFNSALFSLGKIREFSHLQALEATEYMIHRNIERRRKKSIGSTFDIGDKVLIKNPLLQVQKRHKDLLLSHNVIGTIVDCCPSEMYKVQLEDGSETYEKSIFKGQMVLYKSNNEESTNVPTSDISSYKVIINMISEFAENVREKAYLSPKRFRNRSKFDFSFYLPRYFEILDYGALSELYQNLDDVKAAQFQSKFLEALQILKNLKFPYFLYGTVAWERERKAKLPSKYFEVMQHATVEHDCANCIKAGMCNHECCIVVAKQYLEALGFQVKKQVRKQVVSETPPCKNNGKQIKEKSDQESQPKLKKRKSDIALPQNLVELKNVLINNEIEEMHRNNISSFFASIEKRLTKVPPFEKPFLKNMGHLTSVITKDSNSQVTLVGKVVEGKVLHIQVQGNTNLCGLCALNSTVGSLDGLEIVFTEKQLNRIADRQWFMISSAHSFDIVDSVIESNRSLLGDYNIDVLRGAAEESGHHWENLGPAFCNVLRSNVLENEIGCYLLIVQHCNVVEGTRLLVSTGKNHYLCMALFTSCVVKLDSKPPELESMTIPSFIKFLVECCKQREFQAVRISKNMDVNGISTVSNESKLSAEEASNDQVDNVGTVVETVKEVIADDGNVDNNQYEDAAIHNTPYKNCADPYQGTPPTFTHFAEENFPYLIKAFFWFKKNSSVFNELPMLPDVFTCEDPDFQEEMKQCLKKEDSVILYEDMEDRERSRWFIQQYASFKFGDLKDMSDAVSLLRDDRIPINAILRNGDDHDLIVTECEDTKPTSRQDHDRYFKRHLRKCLK